MTTFDDRERSEESKYKHSEELRFKMRNRRNRLFVAGGATGKAFVYDAATGADLASYQLAPAGTAVTFVNDVVVTSKAAYFTDSRNQQLYVLPLGRHGALPDQDEVSARRRERAGAGASDALSHPRDYSHPPVELHP